MKQVYNKKHITFVCDFNVGHRVNIFYVEHDEALSEQGIHLIEGDYLLSLESKEVVDALHTAERDGFRAIFIHKLPNNVVRIADYKNRKGA